MWLILGAVLLAFSQGRWTVPLFALLAPIFLIRYVRTSAVPWALAGFVVAHTAAWEVAYLGMVPLPAVAHVCLFTGLSLVLGLVFLADRWAARRSEGVLATLVLPCGWVAFDFLIGIASPNGTWGSIAYSFSDQLPVAQIVSVTGWTGLTFLVGWLATTVNRLWEHGPSAWRGAAACVGTLVGVMVFGGVRLALAPATPQNRHIRATL